MELHVTKIDQEPLLGVQIQLGRIVKETPFTFDQVMHAFETLRPKFYTDTQTVESVARLALITMRAGEQDIDRAAEVVAELAEDVDRDNPPVDPRPGPGEMLAKVIEMHPAPPESQARKKRLPPGTIRVEGGQKSPVKFAPEQEPGVVDPEAVKMVAEGKARYHLDTLTELAAESNAAIRFEMQRDDVAEAWKNLQPVLQAEVDRMVQTMMLPASMAPTVERSGYAQAKLHEEMRRAHAYGATSPRVDASKRDTSRGCRSAGCRTLGACLCDCKRCRSECRK